MSDSINHDRINYPALTCPIHGVPLRRVGPLYYCPVTPPTPPTPLEVATAENERLRALNVQLAERVAAQSELLTRKAAKRTQPS